MNEEFHQVHQGNWLVTWVKIQNPINQPEERGNASRRQNAESNAESQHMEAENMSSLWLCPALGLAIPGPRTMAPSLWPSYPSRPSPSSSSHPLQVGRAGQHRAGQSRAGASRHKLIRFLFSLHSRGRKSLMTCCPFQTRVPADTASVGQCCSATGILQ